MREIGKYHNPKLMRPQDCEGKKKLRMFNDGNSENKNKKKERERAESNSTEGRAVSYLGMDLGTEDGGHRRKTFTVPMVRGLADLRTH